MFANAAHDFVSCLIHHVRGSDERQQIEEIISIEEMAALNASNGAEDLVQVRECGAPIMRKMINSIVVFRLLSFTSPAATPS